MALMASCCQNKCKCDCDCDACKNCENKTEAAAGEEAVAEIVENEQYDLAQLKQD